MSHYQPFKQQVLNACQELARQGYLIGAGGNVSMRIEGEDALAITPSSRDYLTLTLDDICVYAFDKTPLEGELTPSIEMGMHTAVYQNRPDVNAVIHTHQPRASVFTLINAPIPALFDEQVTQLGNCVEIVPYGMSGSPDLADNLTAMLDNQCNAYILQNHGIICMGTGMVKTAVNIKVLEKCALVYQAALATGKKITCLPPASEQAFFGMLKNEQRKEVRRKRKLAGFEQTLSTKTCFFGNLSGLKLTVMINQQMKETLNEKIQEGEFDVADIPAYLTLFCEMGNEVEDLQDEVEDWNRRIVFDMEGMGKQWIIIEDGQFSTGAGALDDANLTFTFSAIDAAQVFAGDKDARAAYMSGALKVAGDLPDAVKIQTLIEIVVEEIEY